MAIKPELKEWLDRLPVNDNVRSILNGELEKDDVQTKFFETMVPRSEYSKALNNKDAEVLTAKQQIEADKKAALAAKTSYETFQANEQKKVDKFYADNNAALVAEQKQRKAYEARLGELVSQGLITQEEATVAKTEFTPAAPVPPREESKKYISKEELESTIGSTYAQNARNIARLNDIASLHQELFGTRLSQRELVEAALQATGNTTVEQVWAEKYGVEAKRQELQKISEEARIKAAVDEAVVRDRSERAISGDNAPFTGLDDGGNKHILSIFSSKDALHKGLGVTPTVAKATEAYRQRQASGVGSKTG